MSRPPDSATTTQDAWDAITTGPGTETQVIVPGTPAPPPGPADFVALEYLVGGAILHLVTSQILTPTDWPPD